MKDKMVKWTCENIGEIMEAVTIAAIGGFGYICFMLGRLDAQC